MFEAARFAAGFPLKTQSANRQLQKKKNTYPYLNLMATPTSRLLLEGVFESPSNLDDLGLW